MTTRLKLQACLACGHKMDMHEQLADDGERNAKPTPNDVTLCIRCGMVMGFDRKLRFRHLTPEEHAEIEQDERVQAAVKAIGQLPWSPPRQ